MFFTDEELDYEAPDFADAFAEIDAAYVRGDITRAERNRQQRRLDILRTVAPAYHERAAIRHTR